MSRPMCFPLCIAALSTFSIVPLFQSSTALWYGTPGDMKEKILPPGNSPSRAEALSPICSLDSPWTGFKTLNSWAIPQIFFKLLTDSSAQPIWEHLIYPGAGTHINAWIPWETMYTQLWQFTAFLPVIASWHFMSPWHISIFAWISWKFKNMNDKWLLVFHPWN